MPDPPGPPAPGAPVPGDGRRAFGAIRGRGTGDTPAGRFEPIEFVRDPDAWVDEEDLKPDPRTQYLDDVSRSALATNQSPDVGFNTSLNPYRGCEHGCVYCLGPDTPVLHVDMTWRRIGDVRIGDVLVGFDEFPETGRTRKLRPSAVLAVWWSRKPTVRLITQNNEVITTAEHQWLQARSFRWSRTSQLRPGSQLRHLPVIAEEPADDDYRVGYISGLTLGDGTFRYKHGWRSSRLGFPQAYWRVAMKDRGPLERVACYLRNFGVDVYLRPFSAGPRTNTEMWKVETRSLGKLAVISRLLAAERPSRSYRRGFLAGFFDAEGHNGTSLRITQLAVPRLDRVQRYAASLGLEFRLEQREFGASSVRLVGSLADRMRFFSTCHPALGRKIHRLFGKTPATRFEPTEAIEGGPRRDVVDIQTSTGTFYASGLATHNCYARPTHEYLGLSAGLDFETKILVKRDAPELLRKALASPKWTPQVIAVSGVTDAYQPVEAHLKLTRRCLQVMAEFRNPVAVITKSRLVSRDADVLGELARHDAAAVNLSVTSLDPALTRVMEPRAAQPRSRLAAIESLAKAGVPVGAMIGPVVPGLTDHELPGIVQAVANAGAQWAGYIVMRLPFGVKELFEGWLETHFPERKSRVLGRVRALRDGRLNDPRFGSRMRGEGLFAEQIRDLFRLACRRNGLPTKGPDLSTAAFRRPGGEQLPLL